MNDSIKDSADRGKAIRLVDYLARLANLWSKIVRNVDEYEKVFWVNEVPNRQGCFTRAKENDEDYDSDIWVEIQNRSQPKLPDVPNICKDWVDKKSLENKSDLPELPTEITREIKNPNWSEDSGEPELITHSEYLEDFPQVKRAWESWVENEWLTWQENHDDWETINKVYSELFAIHQEQIRRGEECELVLAIGLLNWHTGEQNIRRHLLVADAILEFEAQLGKFILREHPDGSKLRLELDMLRNIETPPARDAEQEAKATLEKVRDDPWNKDVVEEVLKTLVHWLDSRGEYKDSLEGKGINTSPNPIAIYAPAFILRKRSTKGLTEILKRIREQIENGEKLPPEFCDLAEIPRMSGENTGDYPPATTTSIDGEVFFPKPCNNEQRLIVDKIRSTDGVLVQGPPGTGKSHTIANLICHLLATGKRTLITAKTSRALEVLEKLVPPELRALCINLIGNGYEETRSLESSVSGILREYQGWNENSSSQERESLEAKLRELREQKVKIDRRLRANRESETSPQSISQGTYCGTAAEIAEAVNRDRNAYEWLTDDVPIDKPCPVSEEELRFVLEGLRNFSSEKRRELNLKLPNEFPSQARWRNLVENELNATRDENKTLSGADERVADLLSRQTNAYIESVRDTLSQFLDMRRNLMTSAYSWMEEVIRDAIAGNTESWRQISEATKHTLITIEPLVEVADNTDLHNPENINLRMLHDAANQLQLHLKDGGKLDWWRFPPKTVRKNLKLTKSIHLNGQKCSTLRDYSDLVSALSVRLGCEKAWGFWVGRAERSQGPYQLQIHELRRLDDTLEEALSLEERTNRCRQVVGQIAEMGQPQWSEESQVETIVVSCRLALARQRKRECELEIRSIEEPVALLAENSNAHALAIKLRDAIRARDVAGFANTANMIQSLHDEQKRVQKVDNYVSTMREHLPRIIDELKQTCDDARWEDRINNLQNAWRWAHAKYWVEKYIQKEDVPALTRQAKQIEDDINHTIAKLSALHAWSFCFSRLTETHRRHMAAWQQSMLKLGKGTGKHAPHRRRAARQHLSQCREAVPVWVMPLHRVWDTVDPDPGMFDVIIVDEASQCGVEAMPLFYLGTKMLIVGDDKQISPVPVGLRREPVFRLMDELLDDYHFQSFFDVEGSLFDHGKLRYGAQRITLREHFRCMPEIIRFSNDLCYRDTPLIPLRQYGRDRLVPLESVFVSEGYREGGEHNAINRPEADAVVDKIVNLCNDKRYDDKSMGVVVLQSGRQDRLIENELLERLGAEEMQRRKLICGDPYSFQGDERHIMFLSMVAATNERIGPLTTEAHKRRFNVAASRAQDQMYLFHSVTSDDLSPKCLRRRLLEFFQNKTSQQNGLINQEAVERSALQENRKIVSAPKPFDSWFEVDVYLEIARRGFNVVPQFEVAARRIDLVIEGGIARLAVECDGDKWHGPDKYDDDMLRQRQLERCGWEFVRIRESAFNLNREEALQGLWRALEERDIFPLR